MTPIRLGMITPSSNTVLEPMCAAILHHHPHITAHFARIQVTRIALTPTALAQFDPAPMLAAAHLLADARPHAIAWNGTSAAWLGLDSDRTLCAAITEAAGIPATTAVLAMLEALARLRARRIALVTPYTTDIQSRIAETLTQAGHEITAERHLQDPGNFSFATHEEPLLATLIRDVATTAPDAIVTLCTNLRTTAIAAPLEAELAIPVLDSIAATVWHSLELAGARTRIEGWGQIFRLPRA